MTFKDAREVEDSYDQRLGVQHQPQRQSGPSLCSPSIPCMRVSMPVSPLRSSTKGMFCQYDKRDVCVCVCVRMRGLGSQGSESYGRGKTLFFGEIMAITVVLETGSCRSKD
jgi:hypothetical protein